jgi:hypothetical protein
LWRSWRKWVWDKDIFVPFVNSYVEINCIENKLHRNLVKSFSFLETSNTPNV